MSATEQTSPLKRTTIADEVFHFLRNEIISLKIEPGTQLSEVEVAKSFGVSRQPVREAFMRLGDLDLLLIRPQKATLVKKISLTEIAHTRFIRLALEAEIVQVASKEANADAISKLRDNLDQQEQARDDNNPVEMRLLDYTFHRLICDAANRPRAFDVVSEFKAHTDRICRIELADAQGMNETVLGHTRIVDAIEDGDTDAAAATTRSHLSHLDDTLSSALDRFPGYFEV